MGFTLSVTGTHRSVGSVMLVVESRCTYCRIHAYPIFNDK